MPIPCICCAYAQHGAIWDIYRWEDTAAILQLLHAVARERDVEITNNPIHDQAWA